MPTKIKTIIILGPTSSGKSDLAVKLAEKLKKQTGKESEIISVDSRQIYKDMDLGTGKVEGVWKYQGKTSVFTYKNIPHHLIDFIDPRSHSQKSTELGRGNASTYTTYTVINFREDALRLIKEISSRGNVPILCGGTGFWISAVVDNNVFPEVKPNEKLRKKLNSKTAEELFLILKEKDPTRAKNIDPQNKYRLIRALEICEKLGKVPTSKSNPPKNIDFLQIGLDYPVEKLAKKIKKRLASRWTDGMIEEIKSLKKKYKMDWKEVETFGLAYYWIPRYLQGKLEDSQGNLITDPKRAKNELLERVYFAEKNYAKRQRTWFKRDKRIIWTTNFKEILKLSKKFLYF